MISSAILCRSSSGRPVSTETWHWTKTRWRAQTHLPGHPEPMKRLYRRRIDGLEFAQRRDQGF